MDVLASSTIVERISNAILEESQHETDHKMNTLRKRLWSECFEDQQKSFKKIKLADGSAKMIELSEDEIIHIHDVFKGTYQQHLMDKVLERFTNCLRIAETDSDEDISAEDFFDTEDQKTYLEQINEGKSRAGLILGNEIYAICDQQKQKAHPFIKKIKQFVIRILKKSPYQTNSFVPEEKFLTLAQNYAKNHPEKLSENDLHNLAYRLQVANRLESCFDSSQESEDSLIESLGHLLFLTQTNVELAAKCIQDNFEESLKTIYFRSLDLLKEHFNEINQQADSFRQTFVQDYKEFILQKTSLELAKCLILPAGGINFGLINSLKKEGFHPEIASTTAAETMRRNLNHFKNPQILMLLEQVQVPTDPKSPSTELIKITLGLKHDDIITKEHVLQVILSAMIRDFRQAQAGTCFVTADLINKAVNHPYLCLEDYMELVTEGHLVRLIIKEFKTFPFQLVVTKENLSSQIKIDSDAKVVHVIPEGSSFSNQEIQTPAKDIFLWNIPGIKAILDSMGLYQTKQTCLKMMRQFGLETFTIDQFINKCASYAFTKPGLSLRGKELLSKDTLINQGRYAFSAQLLHPFHRAYEQVRASIVQYFGSQYVFAQLTYKVVKKTLTSIGDKSPYYSKLIERLFMPMIARMKYQYNPHLNEDGLNSQDRSTPSLARDFGYELWDTGLPEDYQFDPLYYRQFYQSSFYIHCKPFEKYASPSKWKCLKNEEDFKAFLIDLIEVAAIQAKESHPNSPLEKWDQAAASMIKKIRQPKFIEKLVINFCDRDPDLVNKYKKNEKTFSTLPWKLRWGGSPQIALYTNHNLTDLSIRNHEFAGSCKEVLIYQLNYLKKLYREGFLDERNIPMASPCHAFLLTPSEPSLQRAFLSEKDPENYITDHILIPCRDVCSSILPQASRDQLIKDLLSLKWYRASNERHEYVRQELADPELFNELFNQHKNDLPRSPSYSQFVQWLCKVLIDTRRADPRFGKPHAYWEKQLKSIFNKKLTQFFPGQNLNEKISKEHQALLIEFAKNRKDTIKLTSEELEKIRELALTIPPNLNINQFRDHLVDLAVQVHENYLGYPQKSWKKMIRSFLDNQIFKLLPGEHQKKIKDTMILAHDTNWVDGIHHLFFSYAVNPGSGELELCMYNKDTKELRFRTQESWFPKGKEGMRWHFPGRYLIGENTSIFNFRKIELNEV